MAELVEIMAKIELFSNEKGRRIPFSSGYRPIFNFEGAPTKISGRIDLINQDVFAPGETGVVKVTFIKGMISDKYFRVGENFSFAEEPNPIGKGEIIEVIDE